VASIRSATPTRHTAGLLLAAVILELLLCPLAPAAQTPGPSTESGRYPTNTLTDGKRDWSVSVRWENDKFGGTDRFYTDGISISLAHTGPSWMDPLANWLPWGHGRRTVGYDITQIMITPEDTLSDVPDPDDRPYAGMLTFGLALHVEQSNNYHGLKFIAGVIGPWSLAGKTQREVHRCLDVELPQGWDYQLENEPILNLTYEYRHKFRLAGQSDGWSVEALPIAGASLGMGNACTQSQIGGLVRFGRRMPDDFGATLVRGMGHLPPPRGTGKLNGSSDWGFSIYGGGLAHLVFWDITLDGNTFEDSPDVDKNFFVPAGSVGASVGNRRCLTSFMYVFWGKEFEDQDDFTRFGSVTFSYFF
jgi:hypothetical protein